MKIPPPEDEAFFFSHPYNLQFHSMPMFGRRELHVRRCRRIDKETYKRANTPNDCIICFANANLQRPTLKGPVKGSRKRVK